MDKAFFSILLEPWFQFIALPILTTFLSIGVKIVARKRQDDIPTQREDLFVGLELGMTACLILIFEAIKKYKIISENPEKTSELFPTFVLVLLTICGLGLVLFGVAYIIGYKGWKQKTGATEFVLTKNTIVWTDILGVVYLIIVNLIIAD